MKKVFLVLLSLNSITVTAQHDTATHKTKAMETKSQNSINIASPKITDKKAILSVIDTYIEGLRVGRVDLLKKCFYKDAIMYGYSVENKITEGSVQHLYDLIEKFGGLPQVTSQNSVLNQTSNTASVLADLKTTAPHENSTDYLSLMKINGEWKIISKVYHLWYAK